MVKKIYIAGPFFNPAQSALISNIEQLLDSLCLPYFSPRNAVESKSLRTAEHAERLKMYPVIFQKNIEEITSSDLVLACIDWLLPHDEVVAWFSEDGGERRLNIPDAGTVFEIGVAYAKDIPVVLYTTGRASKPNIMLSQSCLAYCDGIPKLQQFLECISVRKESF